MAAKQHHKLANRLGSTLARIRIERGYTQELLAERLEVTVETISRFERGAVLPTLPRLYELADVLAVPVTELLQRGSTRPNDAATEIASLLGRLSVDDQALVRRWFGEMCERLGDSQPLRKK
ncbi:helix-turn-helix transcriptional regulator [Paraburkholderia azotifigens]|uniref:Helix-turn-helix transcriptional regulator n=1 Tax=Paraburkholderia azotifigens TaxID=2057004 RepID=A0ABU9RHI1_9BURK